MKLFYYPGDPALKATLKCGSDPAEPLPLDTWLGLYLLLHNKDHSSIYSTFVAKDWDSLRFDSGPSQNGEFFAKKSYERTISLGGDVTLTEETWFFLKHTPNFPMPACP